MKQHPVCIVGAGPVGLVVALRLASFGIPSVVLERETELPQDLRASTFHPPTLEMLDELDLSHDLIETGLKAPTWQVRLHESNEAAVFDLALIAGDTKYPFRLQNEQKKLCALALAKAQSNDLVDIRLGAAYDTLTETKDSIVVHYTQDGEQHRLETPILVAADGSRSSVRKAMDLQFDGLTYPETTILATTTFPFQEHLPKLSNVNYVWYAQGTFSLLRLPELWRVSLYANKNETIDEALKPDSVQAKLQTIVQQDTPYVVGEVRAYRIHQRILKDYRRGRVLFAGDAAHLNSPSGGMGMNGGIHDAFCLCDLLKHFLEGRTKLDSLDRYTRQRQPIAEAEILSRAHKNRTRMQERNPETRHTMLRELQAIASDPTRARAHLLGSSMIEGLRKADLVD